MDWEVVWTEIEELRRVEILSLWYSARREPNLPN